MTLYAFNPKQLNYDDSGEFIVRYLTDVENQSIDLTVDLDFKELHEVLVAQSEVFNKALAQVRAKAESNDLLILDRKRDKKLSTLRTQLTVAKNSDEEAIKKAYLIIKIVMDAYKRSSFINYPTESLAIKNLVSELRSSTNLPYCEQLLLVPHIDNLEAVNNQFIEKFNIRSTKIIATEKLDTKQLRKEILETYNDLAEYIMVMAKRKKNDYYNTLLTTINYSRQYFATIISGYNRGKKNKEA